MKTAVITQRRSDSTTGTQLAYSYWHECEDVFIETTDADVYYLSASLTDPSIRLRRSVGRNLRRRASSTVNLPANRRLEKLADRYDLVVFLPYTPWDLQLLEAIPGLKSAADRLFIWYLELWPQSFSNPRLGGEPYGLADQLLCSHSSGAEALANVTGQNVELLPLASDVMRFKPKGIKLARPIAAYNIGRRQPKFHQQVLIWADKTQSFYVYDTFKIGSVTDSAEHRQALASHYKRSRVAVCNYAKFDQPELIAGERLIPGRLWDGLASGAVLFGQPPNENEQDAIIGAQVVVPMAADPVEAAQQVASLASSNQDESRQRNLSLALNKGDWVHRWAEVFKLAELPPPAGLQQRLAELSDEAHELEHASTR